jgi:hypothetical protein
MTDDPHYQAFGVCFGCGRTFGFNPHRVPSIPVRADGTIAADGDRKPICRDCATLANQVREAQGLPLWDVSDAAYDPVPGHGPE